METRNGGRRAAIAAEVLAMLRSDDEASSHAEADSDSDGFFFLDGDPADPNGPLSIEDGNDSILEGVSSVSVSPAQSSDEGEEDSDQDGEWWLVEPPFEAHDDQTAARHIEEGIPLGFNGCQTPYDFFMKFMGLHSMREWLATTNLHCANQQRRKKDRDAPPFTLDEFRSALGILICFGFLGNRTAKRCAWSTNEFRRYEPIASAMPRDRFECFMANLCFTDPENDDNSLLFKVRPVLTAFLDCCRTCFDAKGFVTFDEAVVLMSGRGKKGVAQLFKRKPISKGVRIEALCQGSGRFKGYLHTFLISRDADTAEKWLSDFPFQTYLDSCSATSRTFIAIIWHFLSGTVLTPEMRRRARFLMGIVMDNLFTRPELFEVLAKLHCWAHGTWRKNYSYPDVLKNSVVSADRPGVFAAKMISLGDSENSPTVRMIGAKLRGTGSKESGFSMLSTNPYVLGETQVGKAPFGQEEQELFDFQTFYNSGKTGVDQFDQLRASYDFGVCYRKWTVTIFLWVLNSAIVNSYICYRGIVDDRMDHRTFREHLARRLMTKLDEIGPEAKRLRLDSPLPVPVSGFSLVSQKATKSRVQQRHSERLIGHHFPVRLEGSGKKDCVFCKLHGERKRTVYGCDTCELPLCIDICFKKFHTDDQLPVKK